MAQLTMFEDSDEKIVDDFQFVFNDKIDIQLGDMFQLGDHYLMCGDATNYHHIKKLLNGNLIDLYITDPPYNVSYEGKTLEKMTIMNDKMNNDDFRLFLRKSFANINQYLKEGSTFYIFHADSEGYNFRGACNDVLWKIRQCLIWNKNTFILGRQDYHWKHEPILYGWKEGAAHNWYGDRSQNTVLDYEKPNRNELHPTMKPTELYIYLMKNSSKKGDIVLDNFAGSGTVIIASEYTGRKGYAMELDPIYCNVIIQRWQQLTGKKAIKVEHSIST